MEPKTKIQKEVAKIYLKLPPISQKQYDWAYKKFTKYSLIQRNRFYCLECGHNESIKENFEVLLMKIQNKTVCPKCKAIAKPEVKSMPRRMQVETFKILTTFKGQQVIRIVYGYKKLKRGAESELTFYETMQHWINEDGKIVSLSKPRAFMAQYIDSFILYAPMAFKSSAFVMSALFDIDPEDICPNYKILPILKRNGFVIKALQSVIPQALFPELLKNSQIETLMKANQLELLKFALSYYPKNEYQFNKIKTFWPQIKIAIRNNYIIKDPNVWIDYIENLEKCNKDILNSKFICPIDLTKEHEKYLEKLRQIRRKEKLDALKQQIEIDNENYLDKKKVFLDLFFKFENISIEMMQSVNQVFNEGYELKHCIFENEYYKKKNTILLSAKVDDKVTETVEVDLNQFKILQARGISNKPSEYNEAIIKVINDNIKEIKKRTKKYLKQVA